MHLVLVEPHPESVADAFDHLALNMVEMANFTVWQAGLGPEAGSASFNTRACSLTTGHAPPVVTAPTHPHAPSERAHHHAEAETQDVVEVQIVTLEEVLAPFDLVHLLGLSLRPAPPHKPSARTLRCKSTSWRLLSSQCWRTVSRSGATELQ